MQLTYLHIHNFKSIRSMEIRDIERALILVGKNNTGKNSVLMQSARCAAVMRFRTGILMRTVRLSGIELAFP